MREVDGEKSQNNAQVLSKILILYILGVMGAMVVSESVPALDGIAFELHPSSPALLGLVMSLPSVVVALGALLAGTVVDRFGDKRLLLIGAGIVIVSDLASGSASSIPMLLGARVAGGFGYVFTSVAGVTLMIRMTTGKQRIWALSLWSTFVPASFILPMACAGLVARAGWRFAFFGHGMLLAAIAALGYAMLPESPRAAAGPRPSRTAGLGQVLRTPYVYMLGVTFGADAFIHNGVISTFGPLVHRSYGANPIAASQWNIGSLFMEILGSLLLGRLVTMDLSLLKVLGASMAILAVPGLALYTCGIGTVGSLICSYVLMLGTGLLTAMWCWVPRIAPSPEATGATSGMVTQLTLLGVLVSGPVWFTAFSSNGRYTMAAVLGVAILLMFLQFPVVAWTQGPRRLEGNGEALAAVGND